MLPNWHYTKKSLADVRCKSCLTYACHLIYTSLVVPTDCSNCLPKYQLCYIHDTGMSLYLLEIYGFNSYCYHCNHSQEYIQELKSLYRQEHKSTFQPQEKKNLLFFHWDKRWISNRFETLYLSKGLWRIQVLTGKQISAPCLRQQGTWTQSGSTNCWSPATPDQARSSPMGRTEIFQEVFWLPYLEKLEVATCCKAIGC